MVTDLCLAQGAHKLVHNYHFGSATELISFDVLVEKLAIRCF